MNKTKHKSCFYNQRLSRVRGFTLLELMIVLVIASILFTFAILTIRTSSPEDLIKEEAHRLQRLIQLALEEAVLKNTEYGLEFQTNSYRFLSLTDNSWQAISKDKLFRQRELPDEMEIELIIDQDEFDFDEAAEVDSEDSENEDEEKIEPQIFLYSSEEISQKFSARFTLRGVETSYIVSGSIDGKQKVERSDY